MVKQKTKEIDELTEQLKTEHARLEETKSQLLLTEQNLATLCSEKVSVHIIGYAHLVCQLNFLC